MRRVERLEPHLRRRRYCPEIDKRFCEATVSGLLKHHAVRPPAFAHLTARNGCLYRCMLPPAALGYSFLTTSKVSLESTADLSQLSVGQSNHSNRKLGAHKCSKCGSQDASGIKQQHSNCDSMLQNHDELCLES